MNNSEKIAKLKLALRGLDLHIKPLNKNVNEPFLTDTFF
jgi:hypothetical protein